MPVPAALAALRAALRPKIPLKAELLLQMVRGGIAHSPEEASFAGTALDMMDPVPSWIHSDPLRRIAAAKAIYEPYTQPQTRRGFFRNLLGLPERAQQVSAVAEEPWIAQEQYFAPYDDPADPFGVATQDRVGWSSPEDRARTTRYAALSRVLDRGIDPRTVEDAGALYLGTSVEKPWEEDPTRAALQTNSSSS